MSARRDRGARIARARSACRDRCVTRAASLQDQAEKPARSRAWDFLVEVRVASANATLVDGTRHGATVGV
jgi:hypothetical protein